MEPQVYQFKISLVGIQPLTWRRFRVYSNVTFRQLHNIVQIVMGWENYHLYQFLWNDNHFTEQLLGAGDRRSSHVLGEFVTEPGSMLGYEYDFGDDWHHELLLEKVLATTQKPCPICTHGRRACPPEDCGGVWGYMELVRAMKAKRGSAYREYKEWLGGHFDANAFDLIEVNKQLAKTKLWQ